uniref:Uncharacterized protein n=1 Tax=Picea glauca TaxID=3330 RepID=A0A124GNU4_PICGL|nr:hypothetical protein ABT39_MTgene3138 [Picea glauca]QHR86442.1 hypothetical protein Q903MT_gene441 [Picea sitchensis]
MKLLLEPLLLLQAMLQPLSKLNPLALHLEVLQLLALERGEGELGLVQMRG